MALGDVIFTPRLDTKKFNRDIGRLKQDGEKYGLGFAKNFDKGLKRISFKKLSSDIGLFKRGIKATNDELENSYLGAIKARESYQGLVQSYEQFKATADKNTTTALAGLDAKKKELEKQLEALKAYQEGGFGDTSGVRDDYGAISKELEAVNAHMKELSESGWSKEDIATAEAYKQKIREAGVEMLTASKISDGLNRGANAKFAFLKIFGDKIEWLKGKLASLKTKIKSIPLNLLKAPFQITGKVIKGLIGNLKEIPKLAVNAFGSLAKWAKRIALGAVVAGIALMKKGLDRLVEADSETANSVNGLKNALSQLGNALASAFAPILNTVAPILTKFIGMLTSAANAVASFVSALLGKKFTVVASGVADGIGGIGDSASGANDSAKELQRTLMGFDKINKLDSNSGGGSGGGGGGGGASSGGGFDVVPVGDEANQWADKFRESWEDADFYWLGELLANKLNDALEKIPWDKIQNGARKLAGSLATFLNGFIENANWNLVGETIANGLNTAVYFAQTFVTTFNWGALGDAIANTINGFVKKTDWSAIGDTIGTSIYGLLTTINNFLKGTDWSAIGSAIVEMIASIDWVKLFKGAVELIGNIAGAIFDMMSGAITTAKDKLKKWIDSGKIWDDLFAIGEKIIEVGIELFKKGWTTLKDFVGALVEVGLSLIKSGWKKFTDLIFGDGNDEGESSVKMSLKKAWTSFKDWLFGKGTDEGGVEENTTIGMTASLTSWTKGSGFVSTITGMVAEFASSAIKAGVSLAKTVTGWIAEFSGKAIKSGVSLAQTVTGWVAEFSSKAIKAGVNLFETISGWKAEFSEKQKKSGVDFTETISGWIAQFTDKENAIPDDKKTMTGFIAKFTKAVGGFTTDKKKTISGMIAKFTKKKDGLKAKKGQKTISGMTAKFTKKSDALSSSDKKIGGFTAVITKYQDDGKKKTEYYQNLGYGAKGGLYKNGNFQRFASGGLPNGSQLFWAREAGPELVGTLGGHTAVMNNDQIVASVSSGVAKAIAGIRFKMSAPPLAVTSKNASNSSSTESTDNREMINLLTQILKAINAQDTNVYLDGEKIKDNVVQRINNHTRRTGQLELIV